MINILGTLVNKVDYILPTKSNIHRFYIKNKGFFSTIFVNKNVNLEHIIKNIKSCLEF